MRVTESRTKSQHIDFAALIGPVARRLWGQPNQQHSTQHNWRWGTNGSKSIDLKKGTWFDHEHEEGGGTLDLIECELKYTGKDAIDWLTREGLINGSASTNSNRRIVATYPYHDENDKLLFEVVRSEPRSFYQRRPNGNGSWIKNLDDTRRVLYRLPALLKAVAEGATIYIPEGEKDCDNLRKLGLAATTNPGGAGKWRSKYNEALRGAHVILLPDNDDVGRSHVQNVATHLAGIAATVRVLDLAKHWPECPYKGDVSDWLAAGGSADKLAKLTTHASAAAEPKLPFIDMTNWDNEPIPERQWTIQGRVPRNQAGLFSGEGGAGKSIIELTKDVAHVTGKDWLGSLPEQGPALYVGAEDDVDEIHIRLANITSHYGVTFNQLIAGGLYVLCLLGQDATLCAASSKSGKVEVTDLYRQLREAAGDIKPKNISIDTLSRAFAGNETDRVQVYGFAMHMQALAMVAGGSVTVLSHPSLQGIASGSGISGSTAWHGAFRFRQYLKGVKPEEGEPDGDLRELQFKKNQYGPIGETIVVRYQGGLFLPVPGAGSLERAAQDQADDDLFLSIFDQFDKSGRHLSDKPTANNFAPTLFASEPQAKGISKSRFAAAMNRLFAADKIHVAAYGRPAQPRFRIAKGAKTRDA
jgi:RecA-family ATPase